MAAHETPLGAAVLAALSRELRKPLRLITRSLAPLADGRLPSRRTTSRDGAAVRHEPALLESLHLLVVDDDQTSREALADALGACGARVSIAPSVAVALARLRSERFDAVCSDIEMPGASGVTLARAVRASEAPGTRLPLVAISGMIENDAGRAARAAGFDACWQKPLDVQELAHGLRALVDAARRAQLERTPPTVANDGT